MCLFLNFKERSIFWFWNIHKILFYCILTYCDEKLRDETLNWWNNAISCQKQNMTTFDSWWWCERKIWVSMAIFLFVCFLVMNILGFIFRRHLTCYDSFLGCIFGGVVIFTLSFWWMLIKDNKLELGIRGGAFQQWRQS